MAGIRLNEVDKQNIEIIRGILPELKTDSAVIRYSLVIVASCYNKLTPSLKIKNDNGKWGIE